MYSSQSAVSCGVASPTFAERKGLAPMRSREANELMRAEGVAVIAAAVVMSDPLVRRADGVAPVILVGVTAAGPADERHLQLLERVDDILTIAVDVGNRRAFADPDATVDSGAE